MRPVASSFGPVASLMRGRGGPPLVRRLTWVGDSNSNDAIGYANHSHRMVGSWAVSGTTVRNKSWPGETAAQILGHLNDAPDHWADVVIIVCGRNGTPDGDYAASRAAIASIAAQVRGGRFIVVGVPYLPLDVGQNYFEDFNALLSADYGNRYLEPPDLSVYNSGDNTHYSEAGYNLLTDLVEAKVFGFGWLPQVDVGLPAARATHSLYIPNAGYIALGTPAPAPLKLNPADDAFTWLCWYKGADTQGAIVANNAAALSAEWLLGVNSSNLYGATGGAQVIGAISAVGSTWRFSALTCGINESDLRRAQTFSVDNFTTAGVGVSSLSSASAARIGQRSDGSWQLDGRIYQLAFFRRRLSSTMLREFESGGVPKAPKDWRIAPDALWMFDDAAGTSFPEWGGRAPGTGNSLSNTDLSTDTPGA